MKEELGWSDERVEMERAKAIKLIEVDMGKNVSKICCLYEIYMFQN